MPDTIPLPADVTVDPPEVPGITIAPPNPDVGTLVPTEGPQGPEGPQGRPGEIVDWFTGHGPPGLIIGAGPGDMYIDEDTGTLYQLS